VLPLKDAFHLVQSTVDAWLDDKAPSMGAALAYYTLFSIAPLLLIVISVAGLLFGADAARGEIFGQLRGLVGESGAAAIQSMLESVNRPTEGITATVTGIGLVLAGATTVFGELQDALDRIWRAPQRTGSGLWQLLRARLLSFGMVLGIGFLLMVSLVFSAAVEVLQRWWEPWLGGWVAPIALVNHGITFALVTAMFAMIYKLMPRVRIEWPDVLVGAVVTAALFTVGKWLIGLYIGTAGVGSGFGAAGSLVALLVWVYYSAQIFLLGAEFTWVYAHRYGSRRHVPTPAPNGPPGTALRGAG
jgi:membrane protein